MIEELKRFVGPLERRIRSMLMRATVTGVDDSHDIQQIQVERLQGETIDECDRVGEYGFTSVPPRGAEVILAQMGGNADHHVVIGVDDKSRPHPLSDGQVAIYDKAGTKIVLLADGTLLIVASGVVQIQAETQIIGNLEVVGNVSISGTLNGHVP